MAEAGAPAFVAYSVDELYLCPEMTCRTVSDNPRQCPLCHATQMTNLAAIVDRENKDEEAA